MKKCFKCKETLALCMFYKHSKMKDGHLGKCINCAKKDSAKRRLFLIKTSPDWVAKERDRCRVKQEKYRAAGLASKTTQASRIKWQMKNINKRKAHAVANKAQKEGIIKSPGKCQNCGISNVRLEKHHEDYAKPLSVVWLCCKCHGKTKRLNDPDLTYLA